MQEGLENVHDVWKDKLFDEYRKCNKDKVVASFLKSLSSNQPALRSALPVFSIMQRLPNHEFVLRENQNLRRESPCGICSTAYGYPKEFNENEPGTLLDCINSGGVITHNFLHYYYYLYAFNNNSAIEDINIMTDDIRIFSEILDIILGAKEDDTLKKEIIKNVRKVKGLKINQEEAQVLLETLGYCSILESSKHKGLLEEYTNLSVAPRKAHSSDWNYPVDFWVGKDGVNKKALQFWFGKYNELERYWKK